MSKRRVVITGLGMLSPVGNTVEEAWKNLVAGKSGISLIDHFDTTDYPSKIAGLVKDFDSEKFGINKKDARKMDMFIQYGIAAALMAVEDSGPLIKDGPRKISPFFVPSTIINMVSGHVSIRTGARGPNLATVTACSSGTHAIGLSARLIQYGDADVMICGGAEKASTQMGIGGFCSLKALSTRNDEPEKASRPWDIDRNGFILGDGAGVVILEEYEHAKARGAKIYAELAGFGMSSDAFHMTAPPDNGEGAALAMQNAIKDGGITAADVGYVNAHGTSTHLGDLAEIRAVKSTFGDAISSVRVSSTKSMTGHLLGAAGAIEAVITTLAVRDQICPPTINLENPDPEVEGINLVPNVAQKASFKYALSNSFGFGGTNGSLLFKRFEE